MGRVNDRCSEQLQADLGETNGLLMEYTQQIEADVRQEAQINEQQAILSEKLKNLQQFCEEKQAAKSVVLGIVGGLIGLIFRFGIPLLLAVLIVRWLTSIRQKPRKYYR